MTYFSDKINRFFILNHSIKGIYYPIYCVLWVKITHITVLMTAICPNASQKAKTYYLSSINIASPNEKNLYFSFTASSYALSTFSRPARAETSIIRVDSGK